MRKKTAFFILIVIIIFGVFFVNQSIGNKEHFLHKIKSYIPKSTRVFLKENIFVFKHKQELKQRIELLSKEIDELVITQGKVERKLENLLTLHGSIPLQKIEKDKKLKINNSTYILKKFKTEFLFIGKHPGSTGSSYLDYFDNKLFIVSATGILGYVNADKFNSNKFDISIIPTNIKDLIKYDNFYLETAYGIKDILIYKNRIYLSYINELRKNCYNTSIIASNLNYDKLIFEKFFTPNFCVDKNNEYGEFQPHQSGGRMFPFKEDKILFSIGEYRFRDLAQKKENLFGKVIMLDLNNKKSKIISIGHRNPQGLYYNEKRNIIISTEHGPTGGDEINLNISPDEEIKNYGWPVSSYGTKYFAIKYRDENSKYNDPKLYKSHKEHGFIEPIKYFESSVAISEIIEISRNNEENAKMEILVGTMGHEGGINEGMMSLHYFELENNGNIVSSEVIPMNERVRDIINVKEIEKIFLFLETSASIGLLEKTK